MYIKLHLGKTFICILFCKEDFFEKRVNGESSMEKNVEIYTYLLAENYLNSLECKYHKSLIKYIFYIKLIIE